MTRVKGFETPICSGMPFYTGYENNIVQVAPAPAVANIDGDFRPEIITPSYDGYMRCYSPEGTRLWEYQFDNGKGKFIGASGAVIGDLNADNVPEVVFTTYSVEQSVSNLIILDNKGAQLHKVSLAKRGAMSPPCLADIDGDHKVEIVISLKDVLGGGGGGVQIWDVASASDKLLPWPTGRGNNLRNGQSTQPKMNDSAFRNRNQKLLSFGEDARFEIFNLRGQKTGTRKLVSECNVPSGASNSRVPSGVYLYRKTDKKLNTITSGLQLLR
jgi:hypothetical protein